MRSKCRVHVAGWVLVATAVGLGGCSVNAKRAWPGVQSEIARRTGAHAEWVTGRKEERKVAERVAGMLSRDLGIEDAVAIALVNNRSLQARYEDLGIAEADLVQAGLLKNPVFSLAVEFPGRPHTRVDASVEEEFLDVLLLPARKKTAKARFEQVKAEVSAAVMRKAAEVRAAYYRLQADEQLRELQAHVVAAEEGAAAASKQLADAGNVNAVMHDTDQALAGEARVELTAAAADVAEDREELAMLMGLKEATFRVAGRLPELPKEEVQMTGLEERALRERFDVAAAGKRVEVAGRVLGYANLEAVLSGGGMGAAYTRDPDVKGTVGPTVTVPLPLFDQGQAAEARARGELRQARDEYEALCVKVRAEVRKARERMEAERSRAAYYRDVLIPLREKIVKETLLQYNAMFANVFALLQAKQAEIETGRGYVTSLRDYWLARARLQEAVGGRLGAR